MWEFGEVGGFRQSAKRYGKKHGREFINAMDNANAYLAALNAGLSPQQIDRGFIHHEPLGIKAFDESGPGPHKKATRLYAYPCEHTRTLYLILIGEKDGQSRDIQACRQFVTQRQKEHEQSE